MGRRGLRSAKANRQGRVPNNCSMATNTHGSELRARIELVKHCNEWTYTDFGDWLNTVMIAGNGRAGVRQLAMAKCGYATEVIVTLTV